MLNEPETNSEQKLFWFEYCLVLYAQWFTPSVQVPLILVLFEEKLMVQ